MKLCKVTFKNYFKRVRKQKLIGMEEALESLTIFFIFFLLKTEELNINEVFTLHYSYRLQFTFNLYIFLYPT